MSTNITKQKRDELVSKINSIREFLSSSSDENAARLLGFLGELENDVTNKHYGLVFEEHREGIDEKLETALPVLTEDESLEIDRGGQQNFLIEGDNLASLKLLEKTHRGKIDVIYIDPPYNTGNKDFIYDDNFIDSTDTFRHSKWCSFMKKRLEIARKLLSEKGVIFISIDDNEQATLKLLCDEIFGEGNFESFIWKKKGGASNTEKIIGCLTEYILCFFKKKQKGIFNYRKIERTYKYSDEFGSYNLEGIEKTNSGVYARPTMLFPIIDPKTGKEFFPSNGNRWTLGDKVVNKMISENKFSFDYKKRKVYRIKRPEDYEESENVFYNLFLEYGSLASAKDELEEIILDREKFDTPKPTELLFQIFQIATQKSSTILDFFAGSGTTGHAVLKLNAADNGNRRFILCTNNQNNICRDITYERLKRVIEKENYSASLKYFRVDFVDINDKLYYEYADELLAHTRELVELENAINFNKNPKIAICLTEEELDSFCSGKKKINAVEKIYLGHEVQTTGEQEDLFNSKQIEIVRIPNYYYSDVE